MNSDDGIDHVRPPYFVIEVDPLDSNGRVNAGEGRGLYSAPDITEALCRRRNLITEKRCRGADIYSRLPIGQAQDIVDTFVDEGEAE